MNYQKHYDLLIQTRKQFTSFGNLEYWEKHHTIPSCLGGPDTKENIVVLTVREHYVAHRLLVKIHKTNGSLRRAFSNMCASQNGKRRLSSKQLERARQARIGLRHSEETKARKC